jgi:hypothetical protein
MRLTLENLSARVNRLSWEDGRLVAALLRGERRPRFENHGKRHRRQPSD